jgi:hypothetical protein
MARPSNNGWDFVKVGGIYQYKEDSFLATVKILEDNSTDDAYSFKLEVHECNYELPPQNGVFEIYHTKDSGIYSGMMQLYEHVEYSFNPLWIRP